MTHLDQEEQALLDSFEKGEWSPIANQEIEHQHYQAYAKATFKKDKRINIRLSRQDLEALQRRSLEEGIPYQTLVASILHKFVTGRLIEKPR